MTSSMSIRNAPMSLLGAAVVVTCVSVYAIYRKSNVPRKGKGDSSRGTAGTTATATAAAGGGGGGEEDDDKTTPIDNTKTRKAQNEQSSLGSTEIGDKPRIITIDTSGKSSQDDPVAESVLLQLFNEAAEESKQLEDLSDTEKLLLYGLYKQATSGDNLNRTPSIFDTVARAKHTAWKKATGMSKAEAMIHYTELVKRLSRGESIDDDDLDDNDDNDAELLGPSSGMGLKPSTMATTNAELEQEAVVPDNDGSLESRLRLAAAARDGKSIDYLLSKGAVVDGADDTGQTALHFCADAGYIDGLQMLLSSTANVNAVDMDGVSVLQTAVVADRVEAVKLLLERGADPDLADSDGETARSSAMEAGSDDMKALFA